MNNETVQQERSFVTRWIWANLGGYLFGLIGGFILAHIGNIVFPENNVTGWIAIGAGVGLMQLRVLRRRIRGSVWWVLASIIGMAIPFGAYEVVNVVWEYPYDLSLVGLVGHAVAMLFGGALIGVLQLRVLLPYTAQSRWWVLASTIGWISSLVGFAVVAAVGEGLGISPMRWGVVSLLVGPIIGGAALGAVTGVALDRLLRPTPSEG